MIITADQIWFAPINVLHHFARLESVSSPEFKRSKVFRKAYEASLVATMLLGVIKHLKIQFWMQIVKDKEETPDIRTGTFLLKKDQPKEFTIQEIEVVTYEKHSQESIIDFLRRTKLSPTKSYPKDTAILCYVAKNIIIPSWSELHNNLKDTHKENPVIILGQTNKDKEIYTICQIHPTIALITEFDLLKKSYNKKYLGVLRLQTGTGKKLNPLYLHKEKHYPFETLGVKSL